MKAIVILVNFALSIIGLMLGLLGIVWFCASCVILIRADRTGTMNNLNKKLKINDL